MKRKDAKKQRARCFQGFSRGFFFRPLRFYASFFIASLAMLQTNGCLEAIEKKRELSVCAIFKDEAPYFKEWIEYHKLVGVQHFYLYNNNSKDHFFQVLDPYIKQGVVTLVDWPDQPYPETEENAIYRWVKSTQATAYTDGCLKAMDSKWVAFIDVDEFMLPMKEKSMLEVLQNYEGFPGVTLLWHTYGTSRIYQLPKDKLLIEALHMTCAPDHHLNTKVMKSIVKPEEYAGFSWPPHICNFKSQRASFEIPKEEARLNHYINRTAKYFYQCKIAKKEHMDNIKLPDEEVDRLLQVGNDVEDEERVILRFADKLKEKMRQKRVLLIAPLWGSIFDIQNKHANRDGCLEPTYRLLKTCEAAGCSLEQIGSCAALENFDYLISFEVAFSELGLMMHCPKEKRILFLWEPPSILPENYEPKVHDLFSKVYTWNDALVDGKKYFKFFYPALKPMIANPLVFEEKKLCTLIACNKTSRHPNELYSERKRIIDFFEEKHPDEFELYGKGWEDSLKVYKGAVDAKADAMRAFKFCIAYENIKEQPGYITEKIFDCFHAGCVPIYLGAPNILDYIPKNCLIDRRDFASDEDLYSFLKAMSKEEYEGYIRNIQGFLSSGQAKVFSPDYLCKVVLDLIEE